MHTSAGGPSPLLGWRMYLLPPGMCGTAKQRRRTRHISDGIVNEGRCTQKDDNRCARSDVSRGLKRRRPEDIAGI